jgi:hypothetical protein
LGAGVAIAVPLGFAQLGLSIDTDRCPNEAKATASRSMLSLSLLILRLGWQLALNFV